MIEADVKHYPIAIHPKSYRHFPKFQEQKSCRGKKGIRFYFFGQVEHDDYQKEKLKQFYLYLQRKNKKFNADLYPNDHYVLHILWANQFRHQQTYECMESYTKFRLETVPFLQPNRFEPILRKGFYYISGRDKLFRPVIIFRVNAMDPQNMDPYIQAAIYSFQQVLNHLLLPGQVQNWYIIYDLEGINNLWDLPYSAIKKVISSISMNYACRLQKSFIFNAPGIMGFFWKIFSTFMDSYTASKFVITSQNTDKSLFQDIHPSQIEVRYGGTQSNRTQYFPFKVPEPKYDEGKLVSDYQYEQMLKEGKLRRNRIDPKFTR